MKALIPGALALLFVFCLSACGGGGPNAPAPDNNSGNTQDPAPTDEPDNEPQPDPTAYRNIDGNVPEGWHVLSTPGRTELFSARLLKEPGGDFTFVKGICTPKAPGPTEPDEEWDHWREDVSAALLFHVSTDQEDLVAAMKKHGPSLIEGFDPATVMLEDGLAAGGSEDGRYFYAALSNELGTYISAVVLAPGDEHDQRGRQAIEWIESLKPKE